MGARTAVFACRFVGATIGIAAFGGGYLVGLHDEERSVAWREASYAASALRVLRAGRVEKAMLLLETRLDTYLVLHSRGERGLRQWLYPYPAAAIREGIRNAAEYRLTYPSPATDFELREEIAGLALRYK